MQCRRCNSSDMKRHAKDRLKCCGCGATTVKWAEEIRYRRRFPVALIKCAILFHLFLPSSFVKLLIFIMFRRYVSRNTICAWSRKFRDQLPIAYPPVFKSSEKKVSLFADEKFITIGKKKGYWWTVRDHLGNFIASLVSLSRDLSSAKSIFKMSRFVLDNAGKEVVRLVTDGLQAYCKASRTLGKECQHIQTGIQGRLVQIDGKICLVTNNKAESGNAEIENYLGKYQHQFPNLAAAERAAKGFMLIKYLQYGFEAWRTEGKNLLAENRFFELGEETIPFLQG